MRIHLIPLLFAIAVAISGPVQAAGPELDTPLGGWYDSGLDADYARTRAAYPQPPVLRGGQQHRTLIQGRVNPGQPPVLLVVNGTAMPLYADADGRFARPYAFGKGSASVELRQADGKQRRVQFYATRPARAPANLRAILTWDDPRAEVDLHVLTPDGQHATWSSPIQLDGGGFDVDSVDGAGPEIFSTSASEAGIYHFYVNYWGNFDSGGYNFESERHDRDVITCQLTVITNESTASERRLTWVAQLRAIGDLQLITAFGK